MTTTYAGNPAVSDVAWIRFKIQDTGPIYCGDAFHFQDEEIASTLSDDGGNRVLAAGHLLQTWAISIASNPNFQIGRFSEDWRGAVKDMNDKALELIAQAQAAMTGVYFGGVSVADKAGRRADTDRTQAAFRRGMHDNPDAGW